MSSFLLGILDVAPIIFHKSGLVTAEVNNRWWITEKGLVWPHFIVVVYQMTYADFALSRET
ncbi:MAG: hypothetical protein ACLQT6_18895 [Desulfomonilaceae bacterium]